MPIKLLHPHRYSSIVFGKNSWPQPVKGLGFSLLPLQSSLDSQPFQPVGIACGCYAVFPHPQGAFAGWRRFWGRH